MYVCHLIGDVVLQLHLEGRKGWINTGEQQVGEGLGWEDSGVSVCLVKQRMDRITRVTCTKFL